MTTGTPIALMIENVDQRSKDYSEIKDSVPSGPRGLHLRRQIWNPRLSRRRALVGARDRGAGRGRRRRAQDPARHHDPGALVQMGPHPINRDALGLGRGSAAIRSSAPTPRRPRSTRITSTVCARTAPRSAPCIEIVADGVPPGLGAPIYGKLDSDLAAALMSINAVKGVEIGDGFAAATLRGEENADEMRAGNAGAPTFLVQPRGRHSRRHFDRPTGGLPVRREADLVDPDAARKRDP